MKKNIRSKERLRDLELDPDKQGSVSRVFAIMRELSKESRQRKEKRGARIAVESFLIASNINTPGDLQHEDRY